MRREQPHRGQHTTRGGGSRTARALARSVLPVALPLVLLAVALLVVAQRGPVADGAATRTGDSTAVAIDAGLDADTCALLGRAWSVEGCRRDACAESLDRPRDLGDAVVCQRQGRPESMFATAVPERDCTTLNRRWLDAVGLCAAVPDRERALTTQAAACVEPRTTYVVHTETVGDYDECLAPQVARRLERQALRTGIAVGPFIADRSRAQCSLRPGTTYERGRCAPAPRPGSVDQQGTGAVLLVGDSVAWRSSEALAAEHPGWTLDAVPGRAVQQLGDRVRAFLAERPAPEVLVVALGSNPGRNWVLGDYLEAVGPLPAATRVVWVLPYREAAENGVNDAYQIREVGRVGDAMARAAASRPGSCVVDWRRVATDRPALMLDGVHPTRQGERVWADLVGAGVRRCR